MKGHRTMPTIDRAFRPAGYWDPADPRTAVLQNIKGQNRRTVVARHLDVPAPDRELDEELLADTLQGEDRAALGAIHPSWMGGEYLPDYLPGEVEIARIVLESVTQDVVSIRARRRGKDRRILYRVVDEYETTIDCTPRSSRNALTLGQLIALIDSIDTHEDFANEGRTWIEHILGFNAESSFAELADFVTVESLFYPGLREHYRDETRRIAGELLADQE